MSIVTLTTDFGEGDYACGLLHGVVWSISPDAEIVDLTHSIPRQDVLAGAMLMKRCLPFFPPGTVHVCVVDPGVGTRRRPIAASLGDQFFVGPDNGLVTLAANSCRQDKKQLEYVYLNNPVYWLENVSTIFHGRDIFAPAAAHLANGIDLMDMGTRIYDPILIEVPEPIKNGGGFIAQIIHIDHFGNMSTNLPASMLTDPKNVRVTAGRSNIEGISSTFGDKNPSEIVAIIDSSDFLSICVVNGSAEKTLNLKVGSPVDVRWSDSDEESGKLSNHE